MTEHDEQPTAPDEEGQETEVQSGEPEAPAVEADEQEQQDQVAGSAASTGFNPDAPVATSPPPAEAQSGVPALPENADVEPGQQDLAQGTAHAEANTADGEQAQPSQHE